MGNENNISGANAHQDLATKTPEQQVALARAILEVAKRGTYSLSTDEKKTLTQFILLMTQKRPVSEDILTEMNFIVRQHEQNLIALTRRDR